MADETEKRMFWAYPSHDFSNCPNIWREKNLDHSLCKLNIQEGLSIFHELLPLIKLDTSF